MLIKKWSKINLNTLLCVFWGVRTNPYETMFQIHERKLTWALWAMIVITCKKMLEHLNTTYSDMDECATPWMSTCSFIYRSWMVTWYWTWHKGGCAIQHTEVDWPWRSSSLKYYQKIPGRFHHLFYSLYWEGMFINVNVNVYVYSLISPWVQHTSQFTPLVLEISYTVLSPLGRYSAHFLQLMQLTILQFFILPGIHHCWVGRGSMEWEVCPTHMTSSGNQSPDPLILSLTPYPLNHMCGKGLC